MTKESRILSSPAEVASRRVALNLLGSAAKACRRFEEGADDEALHDFRVSLRRLRTCLSSYRPFLGKRIGKKLFKQLGKLASATNAGRDNEVHIEWLKGQLSRRRISQLEQTGARLMLDELEARNQGASQEVIEKVIRDFADVERKLRDRLRRGRGAVRLDSSGQCTIFAEATGRQLYATTVKLRTHLGLTTSVADTEQAHDARLTAKRLRYLVEPIRKEVKGASQTLRQIKRLQDMLGELNDLQVLEKRVATAIKHAADDLADQLVDTASSAKRLTDITRHKPQLHACRALAAVARRIGVRQRSLFELFRRRWLGGNADRFFDQTHQMTCALLPEAQAPSEPEAQAKDETDDSIEAPPADQVDQQHAS